MVKLKWGMEYKGEERGGWICTYLALGLQGHRLCVSHLLFFAACVSARQQLGLRWKHGIVMQESRSPAFVYCSKQNCFMG